MAATEHTTVTHLLEALSAGDPTVFEALVEAVYDELHALARRQRRRWRGEETLNTTALVHEGNEFDCGFENGAVVRVAATTSTEVLGNEITSSIAAGKEPDVESAAIQVRGSATGNEIQGNRIRGRGRVAISVVDSDFGPDKPPGTDGNPRETTFSGNNVQPFDATLATVEVGHGAVDTTINGGSGTLIDNGTGTVVLGNYTPLTQPPSGT